MIQSDKAKISLTLDQQQNRFAPRFFSFVDFAADFAGALHLLLSGFHDHVSGPHAFGCRGAVLGNIDDDNTFHILGNRILLLQLGRDARQC